MDNADALLAGLASGDRAPADVLVPEPAMKRDQDSMDDFEHLDREGKKEEVGESPLHMAQSTTRNATQSFLDMERDEFLDTPRAPSVTEKSDHLADKFTDSESDAGESPLHRPAPPAPVAARDPTPEPSAPMDPTPALIPTPAQKAPEPVPVPTSELKTEMVSAPTISEPKEEPKPITKEVKAPEPAPELPPAAAPKPEPVPEKKEPIPEKNEPAPTKAPMEPKPEATRGPTAHVIEAEVIFCQMGLVESLIYWRSAGRSGAALGAGLALLVALACCSVVSVLAYASLLALSAAVAFRIYKNVLQAVQKTNEGHPFKWLLEKDICVGVERAQSLAAAATAHCNAALHELRRLFLVEDLVDSLKFGVLLWCLTYVGACFNGITLIILGWIALFTLPKAYELNKAQVDANLEIARAKYHEITAKVRALVPIGRKSESEKDK
ncbi:reticulon-1-like isoform X2 [Zerene cesonia]|uniref:reticulon-1-like isoform X2 n=1 Tax=Zerene cesonia TaxID=33412 RepID=UPI0018E51369|nr:reticulon-1-like isoform X2 [Zerene cesonia]